MRSEEEIREELKYHHNWLQRNADIRSDAEFDEYMMHKNYADILRWVSKDEAD